MTYDDIPRVNARNCPGVDPDVHGWLIVATTHRDADTVTQSNWIDFQEAILGSVPTFTPCYRDNAQLHRFGHWAVGWTEALIVRPDTPEERVALDLLRRLEDYPVLDDERLSTVEADEIAEAWYNFGASDFRDHLRRNLDIDSTDPDDLEELDDAIDDLDADDLDTIFHDNGGEAYHTGNEIIYEYPDFTEAELREAITRLKEDQ